MATPTMERISTTIRSNGTIEESRFSISNSCSNISAASDCNSRPRPVKDRLREFCGVLLIEGSDVAHKGKFLQSLYAGGVALWPLGTSLNWFPEHQICHSALRE